MDIKVVMTKEKFNRTDSGKSWKTKPFETTTEEITLAQVQKMTSDEDIQFFRRLGGSERVDYSYTEFGYLPCRLSSIDPTSTLKVVRSFDYVDKQ